MPKLKSIKAYKLIKIVIKLGFSETRQVGSHKTFNHPDGRAVVIAFHSGEEISVGILNKIIKNRLKIPREEFFKLLEEV